MVAAMIANCDHSGRLGLMNCGKTATMKTMPLGLVTLVKNPVRQRLRQLKEPVLMTCAEATAPASAAGAACILVVHCAQPT